MGHDPQVTRVHTYHADASVLGGRIERPFDQVIPVQAPLTLPPVGGYAKAHTESFRLDGVVSVKFGHTQVAGSMSPTGTFSTLATSVIEGLNVLDIFTADRMVAQISLTHPKVGYYPRVTLVGTHYENVRIGGQPVEIDLDLNICKQCDSKSFPIQPCIRDNGFLARVAEQRKRMMDEESVPEWATEQSVPNWVRERYAWGDSKTESGRDSVLCSVVKEIRGEFPGSVFGNVFEIPDFGKGFLGELLVDNGSYQLSLLRFELGCTIKGAGSFGIVKGNGSTNP